MRPPSRRYLVAKRILDIAVSLTALIVVAPILLACALAIRLESPGPVMFSQKRTGRPAALPDVEVPDDGGQRRGAQGRAGAPEHPAAAGLQDPERPADHEGRAVPAATSLDELPQLFNVLRGDMSIVGPRPTSFPASSYELWHTQRLDVAPGMTGLWQLEGRNATTFDERLRLDVKYIRHMSLTRTCA